MSTINWDNFRVRCSAISKVQAESRSNPSITEIQLKELDELEKREKLTEKQQQRVAELLVKKENSKKIVLSDTCIEYLMEAYAWETEKMVCITKEMDIEYTTKGRLCEEDGITLLSLVDGCFYQKNTIRVYNDFLSGEPDIFKGLEIMGCDKIIDIKNCWDYPTFLKKIHSKVDNSWDCQQKGYLDITGAPEAEVAHTLVNMPETIVNDYKRRLFYKMNVATDEAPEYKEAVDILLRSMYFEHIPIHKRVFKVRIEPFAETERMKLYDKVKYCREWLNNFDEMYQSMNFSQYISVQ